jgi:hypothetical protein
MKKKISDAERFESLSEARKEAELAPFTRDEPVRGKPLTPMQRRQFERLRGKAPCAALLPADGLRSAREPRSCP